MESTCIETTNDEAHTQPSLNWWDLQTASYDFNSPFLLELADEQIFLANEVVRIVPKKRMVVFGMWQDKPAVAKLFLDPTRAQRHMDKDATGIHVLLENKIPTPHLLYQGVSKDRRIAVLISERIHHAQGLQAIWKNKKKIEDVTPILQAVITELATQHVLGVMQRDIHLNNFLIQEKKVYTLDGAQIEYAAHLLPKAESLDNLALFLAQLGTGMEPYQEQLCHFYAKLRGWRLKEEDVYAFHLLIKKWQVARWKQFEKKIFRNSSDFMTVRGWGQAGMCVRNHATPELKKLLQNPDTIFSRSDIEILKAGRSSTVIKASVGHQQFIIKRYNRKSIFHWLRRSLRKTRAFHSWRLMQKLMLFDVQTAKPIAFIENRFFGIRGQSYYVTEYITAEHIGEFFERHQNNEEKISQMVQRVVQLFKNFAQLKMTHGDLKMTNLLINQNEQPILIDFDGAAEHGTLYSMRKTWRKDIKRFLRNFSAQPAVYAAFKKILDPE